jgi:hypothetical protein
MDHRRSQQAPTLSTPWWATGKHHGVLSAASWAPIITLDDSLRPSGVKTVAKYALNGLLRCGACAPRLVASSEKRRDGSRARRYRCTLSSGGCNKIGVVAEPLEALVLAEVVAFLDSHHARPVAGIEPEDDQATVDDLNKIAERCSELAYMLPWTRSTALRGAWLPPLSTSVRRRTSAR